MMGRTASRVGVVVFVLVFGTRFLAFRGPANDHYMHLAWAQQLLFGELPGRDFVEPGMPLAVALSAVTQLVWPGPLGDGVLSMLMLAAAAAITAGLVSVVSGSLVAGVSAALVQTAFFPRLYSYPKILVPAVSLLLLFAYARTPSRLRLAALALWTVVAFLFRHDLGLVAGTATALGVLLSHEGDWRAGTRAVATYVGCGLLFVLPYLALLQAGEGIAEHVRAGLEFGRSDAHQLLWLEVPAFPFLSGEPLSSWTNLDAAALLFWTVHATLLAGTLLLALRWRDTGRAAPVIAAALLFLFLYRMYVLRHAVTVRIPDLATVLAIPLAWVVVEFIRQARAHLRVRPLNSLAFAAVAAALAVSVVAGVSTLRDLGEDFRRTNVQRGLRGVVARATQVVLDGRDDGWPSYWPAGEVPEAVRYLSACTSPSDRILITWPAPEYYLFAGRGFAAGHAWFMAPSAFVSERDQDFMLHRLQTQSVPVALVNESRYDEFASSLPRVSEFLERGYETVGDYEIRDGSRISVRVRRGLTAASQYKDSGWPCVV